MDPEKYAVDDYAKDGSSEEVWVIYSCYNDPLQT